MVKVFLKPRAVVGVISILEAHLKFPVIMCAKESSTLESPTLCGKVSPNFQNVALLSSPSSQASMMLNVT